MKTDLPVLATDASEPWFADLPAAPTRDRTRDHRVYHDRFGTTGWHLTVRRRPIALDELARAAATYPHVMVALLSGFDGKKEGILLAHGAALNELAARHPGVLAIGILGEAETHLYHSLPPVATPAEALRNYKRACLLLMAGRKPGDIVAPLIARLDAATLREAASIVYEFEIAPAIELWTTPDKCWAIHEHFAWGADGVFLERSGMNDNVQIAISFLRGAARQYGGKWGLDMSPWGHQHGAGRGPTTYDGANRHVAGVTADLHWFTWLTATLGGAAMIKQQAGECMFFRYPDHTPFGPSNGDTARGFPLSDNQREHDPASWGAPLAPPGDYAARLTELFASGFDRGVPIVPVALLVPPDHGFDDSMWLLEDGTWGGAVPIARGDRLLRALFGHFFPGCHQAGRRTDPAFNPNVPFRDNRELMERWYAGMDMRPYEDGFFVPSPLGDGIDVLTTAATADSLARYPLVIVAGRAAVDAGNLPLLDAYVRQGGTLVVHERGIDLGDDAFGAFCGVRRISGYAPGFHPSRVVATGAEYREGFYEYALVAAEAAEVLVTGEDGRPLITRHALGNGYVVYDAVYHHLTLTGRQLVAGFAAALEALVEPLLPVRIAGPPMQWQAAAIPGGRLVLLGNWAPVAWEGQVSLPGVTGGRAEELLGSAAEPEALDGADDFTFRAAVPPYSMGLYRIR